MSEGLKRPIRNPRQRLIEHGLALFARFGRHRAPPTGTSIAPPIAPDDSKAANEELPPEPAWVEVSRSSWF